MELISKLEKTVAGWLKPIPSLPKTVQKWLAENLWWIALVSVILTAISILVLIGAIGTWSTYSSSITAIYGTSLGLASYAPGWIIGTIITLIFSALITLLMAIAIKPLKSMDSKGWRLLFFVYVLSALQVVVNSVMTLNVVSFIFGIIFGAIGLAIGGYFLFQIKSYFGSTAKAKHIAK